MSDYLICGCCGREVADRCAAHPDDPLLAMNDGDAVVLGENYAHVHRDAGACHRGSTEEQRAEQRAVQAKYAARRRWWQSLSPAEQRRHQSRPMATYPVWSEADRAAFERIVSNPFRPRTIEQARDIVNAGAYQRQISGR